MGRKTSLLSPCGRNTMYARQSSNNTLLLPGLFNTFWKQFRFTGLNRKQRDGVKSCYSLSVFHKKTAGEHAQAFFKFPTVAGNRTSPKLTNRFFNENSKRCISGYKRTFTDVLTGSAKIRLLFYTTNKIRGNYAE